MENGYTGTLEAWLTSLAGATGTAGAKGTDGREIELQVSGSYIQWRYSGETEWHNLIALSAITGATGATGASGSDGSDGSDGADGLNGTSGLNGADGIGISAIEKTATSGNVDTYTITFTNGETTAFTVTNGKDGAGITEGTINEDGELVFTLTDGTELNMGQLSAITDGAIPANGSVLFGKTGANTVIIIAIAVAAIALLSHLGWLIPLLRRKKGE